MQPDPELRAYELLQWVPYSLPSQYDDALATEGLYTRLQRQRSDQALADFDRENPSQTSPELAAFRELERLGILTQNDFYSPAKAKHGFYTKRLSQLQQRDKQRGSGRGITRSIRPALPSADRRRAH